MKKIMKIIAASIAAAAALLTFSACSHRLDSSSDSAPVTTTTTAKYEVDPSKLDKQQSFLVELYPEYAPITCENFEKLVSSGFYDGLNFHRVYKDFMAQGGDGSTMGRTAETIKGEFKTNGFDNQLSHSRGVISMARAGNNPDSANSQFFIVYSDQAKSSLDGRYASFGKVIEGMEVVDSFTNIPMAMGGIDQIPTAPTEPITILKAEVEGKNDKGHALCRFYVQVGNEKK